MKKFPKEFSEILTKRGLDILQGKARTLCSSFANSSKSFLLLKDVIDRRVAIECARILDRRLYRHLATISSKIPADSIWGMTRDYTELLSKTMHVKTAFLQRRTARSYEAAQEIGLLEMMRSSSLLAFAEAITGLNLSREIQCQVLCYEDGDYVGPHNDHYPEMESRRSGYIDLHVMFSNPAVHHQWLVYQDEGHFSRIQNVNTRGGIAVYKLPFWHYTTPLVCRRGLEEEAHRWVLLSTFVQAPQQTAIGSKERDRWIIAHPTPLPNSRPRDTQRDRDTS